MVPFFVFFFSLVFHLTVNKIFILDFEEKTHIEKVMRTMHGDLPLRDFFRFTYAPGHYFLFAGLFWLFSPSLMIEQLAWTVLRALASLLMYWTARLFMPLRYALLPVLLITVLPCSHWKAFYPFFTLLNLLFLSNLLADFSKKWIILSGLVTGLTLCFRQDLALIFGGTAALFIILNSFESLKKRALSFRARAKIFIFSNIKMLGLYSSMMLLPFLPLFVYYLSQGTAFVLLREMFLGHPVRHLRVCRAMPYHFPNIGRLFRWPLDLEVVFLWLPIGLFLAILIIFMTRLFREKHFDVENRQISALVLIGILVYNQTYFYAIFERLLESAAPIYLAFGFLIFRVHSKVRNESSDSRSPRDAKHIISLAMLALLFILPASFAYYGLTTKYTNERLFARRHHDGLIISDTGIWLPKKWILKRIKYTGNFLRSKGSKHDLMLFLNGSLNYFIADQKSLKSLELNVKPLTPESLKQDLEIVAPRFLAIEKTAFQTIYRFPSYLRKYLKAKYQFRIKKGVYYIHEKKAAASSSGGYLTNAECIIK